MFALLKKYADGTSEFLVPAVSGRLAILLGKRWSETLGLTVIGVESLRDGTTRECCRFENGALVGEADFEKANTCEDVAEGKSAKNRCG